MSPSTSSAVHLSVVLPCLNEAETVGACVDAITRVLTARGDTFEVIVVDNGSTDDSARIAEEHGARVIRAEKRGYGNALRTGFHAAHGDIILLMDCDGSYRAEDLPALIHACENGADVAMGCRLPAGGGIIRSGAMPFLHQSIGNPLFSWMTRTVWNIPVDDALCGIRAIRGDLCRSLSFHTTDMTFALEFLLEAKMHGARFATVPVTLQKDGRTLHGPHVRTWRDGWKSFVFLLKNRPKPQKRA